MTISILLRIIGHLVSQPRYQQSGSSCDIESTTQLPQRAVFETNYNPIGRNTDLILWTTAWPSEKNQLHTTQTSLGETPGKIDPDVRSPGTRHFSHHNNIGRIGRSDPVKDNRKIRGFRQGVKRTLGLDVVGRSNCCEKTTNTSDKRHCADNHIRVYAE